jgi:exopolysaccharide biosynthesis protein
VTGPTAPRRLRPGLFLTAALALAVAGAALGFTLAAGSRSSAAATAATSTTTVAEVTSSVPSATTTRANAGATTSSTTAGTGGETTITVTEHTVGSGADTVTYFVADIVLAEGDTLQAAFAGRDLGDGASRNTSTIAAANDAILAINGDNATDRSDGIIIRNGVLYRDVPARVGLAMYQDGTLVVYDETETPGEDLLAQGVWNTWSFGPAVLVDGVVPDGLDTMEVEVNPEHGIEGSQPRSGIGIIDAHHLVFVVVDGRSPGYSRGVTLSEFAAIFQDLGCTSAYNLDGGGSSTLYYQGEVVNDPLGRGEERGVGDILFIG